MNLSAKLKIYIRHLWKSFDEFKFIAGLSLMPIWLGAILQFITDSSISKYLNQYLESGDALLLCTATIGPLLYVIIKDDENISENNRPFPGKSNYIISIMLICAISAAIFGLQTAIKEKTSEVISFDAVWLLSSIISAVSIIIWFLITATKSLREGGAPAMMRVGDTDFIRRYQEDEDD